MSDGIEEDDDTLPAIMTVREAAAAMRMEPKSLRQRVYRGHDPQPVLRGGNRMLFRREDVRRWLLGGTKSGRPQGGER